MRNAVTWLLKQNVIPSSGVGGVSVGNASALPKFLICQKSGQNPLNMGKIPENMGNALNIRAKLAPNVVQKAVPNVGRIT